MKRFIFSFSACIVLLFLVAHASAKPARKILVVGGQLNNPPYEFLENGKPTGFDIDLARAVAAIMGYDVEIRLNPWAQTLKALEQGEINVIAGMYESKDRDKFFDFSVPHTLVYSALVVRQNSSIRSFNDLRGKEIIVVERGFQHELLQKEGLASRIITVQDHAEALKLLSSGKHDAVLLSSRLQGEYFIQKFRLGGLRIINKDGPLLRYCFAVKEGNQEFAYRLDEALNILKINGKYRELYDKWFGVYEKKTWWEVVRYYVAGLALIAALFIASIVWSRSLQKKVEIRTEELRASEGELRRAHAELEQRVQERTADLKTANERLGSSEAEKSIILNSAADLIAYHDPQLKILWANKRAAAQANLLPEEMKGKHCWEVWRHLEGPCPNCPVLAARDTGLPQKMELPSPDGRGTWYVRTYPIKDNQGRITGIAEFALDITERKKIEDLLAKKTRELERSNKELEQFAFTASHDLKAPLMSMAGFADQLKEQYHDKLDDQALKALTRINKGSRRMENLIRDLLTYARVSSSEQIVKPASCAAALDSALTDLQSVIEESNAVVTVDALPVLQGDETQFTQLFLNLVENAIKYRSEQPPRIHVSAHRSDGPEEGSLGYRHQSTIKPGWIFSVSDNGIGMDLAQCVEIFGMFKRLHSQDKYSGTGIGLAICKKIVEQRGGNIWVESEPGKGSTFYFTVPDLPA
jgi:PAS domain S-box-containing protein